MKNDKSTIEADELDRLFDEGGDIIAHLDWSRAERPGLIQERMDFELPVWMIELLDNEAQKIGVTRQSMVKVWLAERLKVERTVSSNHQAPTRKDAPQPITEMRGISKGVDPHIEREGDRL